MKTSSDISVTELEKSVTDILQCQENILKLESKSAEIKSAMINILIKEIDAIERLLRC
jgi:hypothetical protein